MSAFTYEQVSPSIKRIRNCADVCEYLVEGKDAALLIDTGFGIGDLRGYVESLTSLPYEVILTHGHIDHAAGAAQFERVYLHEDDFDLYEHHCSAEARKRELAGGDLDAELAAGDIVPVDPSALAPLDPATVFDLGGVHVRLIAVPGHTAGTVVPVVTEDRIAIFGDACGVGTLLNLPESTTVETYLASLERLAEHRADWDRILRQHGTCESGLALLDDNIELCRRILAGTDDAVATISHGVPSLLAAAQNPTTGKRLDGAEGNIFYRKDNIR